MLESERGRGCVGSERGEQRRMKALRTRSVSNIELGPGLSLDLDERATRA